jgi:type I restriction enzyme S subunit
MNNRENKFPKLRFPEFQSMDTWKIIPLSNILKEHALKSTGTEEVCSVSVQKGIVNQIEHLGRSYSASSTDHYKRVLTGDIVYTKSPTGDFPFGIIKQNKLLFPVIVSPLYGVFTPQNIFLGKILDAYFESPQKTQSYLEPIVQKGAKNTININNSKFLQGKLSIPHDELEQIKISNCLDSIEDLIKSNIIKLDNLKDYKKGMIQKLFPTKGKVLPEQRFHDFKHNGIWCQVPAKKLFSNRVEKGNIKLPIYSVTMNDGLVLRSSLDRKINDIADITANKKACKGDIVYNMMRMWQGALGIAPEDCMVSPAYIVLKPNSDVNPKFFEYLLKSAEILQVLMTHSRGLTADRLRLYYDDFSKISLWYPHLSEQIKIAECISSIDELIEAQTKKVYNLKKFKNGLVQQLLPSISEA